MCDPITLGLMAAGTVASVVGGQVASNESQNNAARIAKARNDVLNRTLAKNKAFADSSREIFDKRVGDIDGNAQAGIQQAQADRTANIQENVEAAPADPVSLPTSGPTVVKSALAKKLSDVFSESTDRAKRLGTLTGFGGFFQDEAIKDASANRDVGVNADSISGNMALMPSLQDFAQIAANKPSSGIGQMLSALGSVAGSAAGARGMGGGGGGAEAGFYRPGVGPDGMGFLHFGGPR